MNFPERLRAARQTAGLTQKELAAAVCVSERTIQNYEIGSRRPRSAEAFEALADALHVGLDTLLDQRDRLVLHAQETGGSRSARDVDALVSEVTGLFAGGDLDEDEKDGIMAALNQAYWIAKEKNRKYASRKPHPDTRDAGKQ